MIGRRHIVTSMVALLALGAPYCAIADDGEKSDSDKWQYAKGLFRSQLDKPAESLNIGLHYWIELTRNGKSQRVSNKFAFKKGDKIQFHLRPNIDGYAYVVMRSGSRGESAVMFPDPAKGDNNRVAHGVDYALPSSGESFEFDANPGTEKVSLLLSRTPIDAQAYLSKPADAPVTIASAITGSKDLVPSQVFVAYASPHEPAPPVVHTAPKKVATTTKQTVAIAAATDDSSESKSAKRHRPVTHTGVTSTKHEVTERVSNNDDAGVTSVIKKSPDGVLFVNVDLEHRG